MKARLLLIPLMMLAGCSTEHEDLQSWMNETKQKAKSHVQKPQPPAPVQPVVYNEPPNISPNAFSYQRMRALKESGQAPNTNRAKEILEDFDLEELKFVGVIGSGNALSGLVEVNGHVYTVKPGNYMGKNYGRIVRITADEIVLKETFEDASGIWSQREAKVVPQADVEEANNN